MLRCGRLSLLYLSRIVEYINFKSFKAGIADDFFQIDPCPAMPGYIRG